MRGIKEGIVPSLGLATLVAFAGCRSDRPAPDSLVTTAALTADSAKPKRPHRMATVRDLSHPESVRYDPELDVWFIANINGGPVAKDNNGFITRVRGDGTADVLKFVEGGRNGVRLNAPKGMAIEADTLWVADIDVVRGFNRRSGAEVATVKLIGQAKFLNDIAAGPDGIYVTDTGAEADPTGNLKHVGPDRIFHVDASRRVSIALETDSLEGPNGITWDSAGRRFVIVPFFGKTLRAWSPGEAAPRAIGSGPGQEDGVEVLAPGRYLFTSWADSSLFVLEEGRTTLLQGALPSPADIGWDSRRHRVAVPLMLENRMEIWALP